MTQNDWHEISSKKAGETTIKKATSFSSLEKVMTETEEKKNEFLTQHYNEIELSKQLFTG